jgi:hypothetical protein
VFTAVRYHTLSPTPGYGTGDGVLQLAPWRGLAFLALDARFGLLSNFPLLVFALAGVALAGRRVPAWTHVVLLGTAVPYLLVIATYPNWDGGYAPPGRFLAVVVPLGCCYVGWALADIDHRVATTLAVLTGAVGFGLAVQSDLHPLERFHWATVPIAMPVERVEARTGLPLHAVVPFAGQPGQWPVFILWGTLAAAVGTALWWAGRRGPRYRACRSPGSAPVRTGTRSGHRGHTRPTACRGTAARTARDRPPAPSPSDRSPGTSSAAAGSPAGGYGSPR